MKHIFDVIIPQSKMLCAFVVGLAVSLVLVGLIGLAYTLPEKSLFIYGFSIFLGVPFFVGFLTPLTISYHNETSVGESIGLSIAALLFVGVSLLTFALEGVICIVMASPIAIVTTIVGSLIGFAFRKKHPLGSKNVFSSFVLFIFLIPSMTFLEGSATGNRELTPVTTMIEINAPPEKVWKNVVEFPELAPPTEFLFKTGIAYPIKARIEGSGKGAIRYCEFSTGAFVEPIEVWDENKLLQFSVEEQPLPMRELSPYGEIDTPHLHDYFVSQKGQFKLTRLENGKTLLEGTTWYYHRIRPEIYWKIWTEQIVHTIHQRVLTHIKEQSEKQS
jgi:hypothetical protein